MGNTIARSTSGAVSMLNTDPQQSSLFSTLQLRSLLMVHLLFAE